jgi:hypothetical protein
MPSMRHNISANRMGSERPYLVICVKDKRGGMNTFYSCALRFFLLLMRMVRRPT